MARQAELLEPIVRGGPATREAFGTLLLRTLELARYDPVNSGHAALASPAYVHFTSPIRRYPDIVVHRATCALADLGEEAPKARDLPEIALRCSQREREAADAERRADAICLAFLLRDRLRRDRLAASRSRAWSPASSEQACSCASATCSRASCRPGGSTRASASTSTSTASRSSGAASGRRIRLGDELSCVVTAVDPPRGRATLDILPEHEAPRPRTARPS